MPWATKSASIWVTLMLKEIVSYAKDYVEMQWLMLQQEKPEDYVIATGTQYSVREFIEFSANELALRLNLKEKV